MNGPAAPKDPEKRRVYFYVIKNKDVFGAKLDDGRGIQYLYQDSERLVNSAQITGGIEDGEILELLRSVEGFRRLVHSIGVSVETEDPTEKAEFIFQMYGKKDIYGGGSNLRIMVNGDGVEQRIYLSDIQWTEDDHIPGQIKVIMEKPGESAKLNVRFYLNDGYDAPEPEEEFEIAFDSNDYRNMIQKSMVSAGDCTRLKRAIHKAKNGEDVTLAYIGGSITQGAGAAPIHTECYAYKSYCLFKQRFGGKENVHFIKAGVGGTPSELGMIRFDRDVLRDYTVKPDIIVIEFAVNDEGDETKGDCYESLVRKAVNLPNEPAVILLFSVFANDENLQDRMIPIGMHYNLPMVSIKNAVTPQFYLDEDDGRILTKNQFFYDIYHPTNIGHSIMADCLVNLMAYAQMAEDTPGTSSTAFLMQSAPVIGNTFEKVKLLDKKDTYSRAQIMPGGFAGTDTVLQSVELDVNLDPTPEFPYNWHYNGTDADHPYFGMQIFCRALVLVFKDSGEIDAAKAHIYVDGRFVRTADPYVNGWLHCNPLIIMNEKESGQHLVRIEVDKKDRAKQCTILGFGYVE